MSDQSTPSNVDPEVAQALMRVHQRASEALRGTDLEQLSVKDLQLHALQQVDSVMANDQKASVISIVLYTTLT